MNPFAPNEGNKRATEKSKREKENRTQHPVYRVPPLLTYLPPTSPVPEGDPAPEVIDTEGKWKKDGPGALPSFKAF